MTTVLDGPPATRPSWPRIHRTIVLALAGVTVVVEVLSLVTGSGQAMGNLLLSASLVPSLALLVALGPRSTGRVEDRARLVPFWLGVGGAYLFGWALWSRRGDGTDIVALLLAAVNEEVVYRFAVPVLLTSALLIVRVPASVARVLGYVVAGTWWVLLPGHRAQTDSLSMLLTFVAFAAVSALVVARSRALLPMAIAHGALNIVTLAQLHGDIEPGVRGVLAASLVVLLVGTYAWPGDDELRARRRAAASDGGVDDLIGDVVIDLRDDVRPSVVRDGAVTYLDVEPDAVTGGPDPQGEAGPIAAPVGDGPLSR